MQFAEFSKIVEFKNGGLILSCLIQPKASREKIIGIHDSSLKIALNSPPVDGKANSALIKFLSKKLRIAKGKILIERGLTSRRKKVFIASEFQLEKLFDLLRN